MSEYRAELTEQTLGTDAQAVIDCATAAAEPAELDPTATYAIAVPAGGSVQVVTPSDAAADAPTRKRGDARVHDAESFLAYMDKHGDDDSEIWADFSRTQLLGVVNSHRVAAAGWGDHRVALEVRETDAWAQWLRLNGQMSRQGVLAEHIEARLVDIVEPTGAHMLELVQSFQATIGVTFESSKKLDNGERQLEYKETIEARAGRRGNLVIPASFQVGIAPFEGAEAYRITARFRYRITDGVLTVGYVLERPEDIKRAAFNGIVSEVREAATCSVYTGVAPPPQAAP